MSARHRPARGSPEAVRRQYAGEARDYDRRWARYLDATLEPTLGELHLPRAGRLLDVGCGTGVLLERVRRGDPEARICGLDLSADMLARARARLGAGAWLVQGSALQLPFAADSFDAVVTASALHHWRDPGRALAEVARVVRPGGRVVVTDWAADHLPTRLLDWVLRATDRSHLRVYTVREVRQMLFAAGLAPLRSHRTRLGIVWGFFTISARPASVPLPPSTRSR